MTNTTDIIKQTEDILVKTYNAQPVVMDRGEGGYAYDTDGKKYLDFAAGIAVASLGHAHPKMLETINKQAARMMTCQASYATQEKLEAAQILIDNSCFDLVYFSNSGTESVEAALKCARKWAYENKGKHCNEIISFKNAFHGRTYGSASVTEKRKTQPFFDPYLDGVHFAEFNDVASVTSLINDNTAAIIVEPVQGEGGLTPANPFFLADLRRLCDAHNICLIFDEIQAGMGRLGTFFAYQSFEIDGNIVEPDIACLAKGMGGGFPVGAMVAKKAYGDAISVGTHGTTYGGNPLACAIAATVMKEILSDGFLENANAVSEYLIDGLQKLQAASNKIKDIRGKGLMIGIDTAFNIKDLLAKLQQNGMMATQAGKATLRLTPPLNLTMNDAYEALQIIHQTLTEME
ncbi:MAG: aspartate aminotransferase family protein [Alphaproteobacteria bacterium]